MSRTRHGQTDWSPAQKFGSGYGGSAVTNGCDHRTALPAMLLGGLVLLGLSAALLFPHPASAAASRVSPGAPLALLALQQARLTASDADLSDAFGYSVAIDGDTALVGAFTDDIGSQTNQGSAYVFTRAGGTWSQQGQLVASDGAGGDGFGRSVSLSGDTALVGAPFDDIGMNSAQGSAYVFVRSGATWTQQTKLVAADGAASDYFGYSVALDRDAAVVGAYMDDVGAVPDMGSVHVFVRSGTSWSPQGAMAALSDSVNLNFGSSVAISGDTVLIGASGYDVGPGDTNEGSAYLFTLAGGVWSGQGLIMADDGAPGDSFGTSVALSGDTAVVGAVEDDVGANVDQGSAYVYVRSGTSWSQQGHLTASDGAAFDAFGTSVALSGDTVLAGASYDDIGMNSDQGSAYLFARHAATWSQETKLVAADGAAEDYLGSATGISADSVIVGAYDSDVSKVDQGSALVFLLDGVAPVTGASPTPAPNRAGWNRRSVTVSLSASDAGSGVARSEYRRAGAADWTAYAAPFLVSAQGVSTFEYRSIDRAGNVEPPKSLTLRIDTTRPLTKALADATVVRGRKATLRLRVNDRIAPQASVSVRIYKGKLLKKTLKLRLRNTNTPIRYGFVCTLARGKYIWKVLATDLAGNKQSKVGYRTLTVR